MNIDKKNVKLNNVIFPVWLLFLAPFTWLIVIPFNFIIDSIVLIIGLYFLKIEEKRVFYKKTILWVFLFGFVSDLVGGIIILITQFFGDSGWFNEYIINPIAQNPFDNIYCFLYTLLAVIISGVLIYILNRFVSFRKIQEIKTKKVLSLMLALITAPYLFLVPTTSFYGGTVNSFTNHIVWNEYIQAEVYTDESSDIDILKAENGEYYSYSVPSAFREGVNTAKRVNKDDYGTFKYKVIFYKTGKSGKKMEPIVFYDKNGVLSFEWQEKYYEVTNSCYQDILESINDVFEQREIDNVEI